ncbi:hypothetical protein [Rhodanobacter sp. MP1X3]|uniref:hypothetical protein n=1 Tax=Rhodanobacter sp. MP1X3 TaxID=2723086 RepID=UPI00182812FB|nr:hypothetical protein [Rhodanobacter sp. MP1X3]MBB6243540.1 hypothetical protein [Rhodanobacter sp. MP1X3]
MFWCALLLTACLGPTFETHARGVETHTLKGSSRGQSADQLSIQIDSDRLTLSVTDVPQVYLYGVIDADAPQRVTALMKSGKIPNGSDIYLNSSNGNLSAGLALGRLFRAGSMVTHLGKPRRKGEINTAVCVGACTYAYFGGLYRWAATGSDRIGLSSYHTMDPAVSGIGQAQQTSDEVVSYLKDMGINPSALTPMATTSHDAVMWLTADQMISSGLANNGRLPLTAKYQPSATGLYLVLDQVDRHGEHRMTIECKRGLVTLTAINQVGAARAKDIVARGARSYFEINRQETLTQPRDGASVASDSVTMARPYPPARLEYIIFAQSVGAWVGDSNSAFRNGFTFYLEPVRSTLKDYYNACWQAAPWPTKQNPNP